MHILVLAPSFFGYRDAIIDNLRKAGNTVDCFSDRPKETVLIKGLGRINFGLIQKWINKHFQTVLDSVKSNNYDKVIVIGGMSYCFTKEQTHCLKTASTAEFVIYLWDSLRNCQRVSDSLSLFDRVYSFENADCINGVEYLPLFFLPEYEEIKLAKDSEIVYDACFIGSVHQVHKFHYVKKVVEKLRANGANVFTYYYMPSRFVAFIRKVTKGDYRGQPFEYTALSGGQVRGYIEQSRVIIDSPQANQEGFTIRTIESIGARRKLITSNLAIKECDYYSCGNVFACSTADDLECSFVKTNVNDIPEGIYRKYSLESWLNVVVTGIR